MATYFIPDRSWNSRSAAILFTRGSNVDSIQGGAFVIDTLRDGDAHFIASM